MIMNMLTAKQNDLEVLVETLNMSGIVNGIKEYSTKKKRYCISGLYDTEYTNMHIIILRFVKIGDTSFLFLQ